MEIKIGMTLYLEYKGSGKTEKYYCKVIDKKEHYIFIDYPIHETTKKTTYFPENAVIKVNFIGKDNVVYHFKTKIVAKATRTIPALIIVHPEKENLKAIQRREFVRIEDTIDIAVHCPQNSIQPFTTVTADISGGGLAFYLQNQKLEQFQMKQKLDLWLVLQLTSGEFQYLSLNSEVVRINESKNKKPTCSVKYLTISTQTQQKIIYYCFEKQREARKKEII